MTGTLIARQAILDRKAELAGYELLYRGSPAPAEARGAWGNQATSKVLVDLLTGDELEELVGGYPVFVNLTREFLLELPHMPLSPERLVLEVLEDVVVDDALLGALRGLARQGYTIALDDFVLSEENRALLEVASLVKVDVRAHGPEELAGMVSALEAEGVRLLAEKVETHEEFVLCQSLGFELFQGFFFARPKEMRGQPLSGDRLNMIHLLSRLHDPELTLEEVTELVERDVTLSYRLLRLINSSYFPFRREVDSVSRAVSYMGLNPVRTWVTWLAMAGAEDKSRELAITTLVRAQMSAYLCEHLRGLSRDQCFTAGLFTSLDALVDRPMSEVVGSLPLSEELSAALLHREGPLGRVLEVVHRFERGEWGGAADLPLEPQVVGEGYRKAVAWAEDLRGALA